MEALFLTFFQQVNKRVGEMHHPHRQIQKAGNVYTALSPPKGLGQRQRGEITDSSVLIEF